MMHAKDYKRVLSMGKCERNDELKHAWMKRKTLVVPLYLLNNWLFLRYLNQIIVSFIWIFIYVLFLHWSCPSDCNVFVLIAPSVYESKRKQISWKRLVTIFVWRFAMYVCSTVTLRWSVFTFALHRKGEGSWKVVLLTAKPSSVEQRRK